jgi:hypothetical protein
LEEQMVVHAAPTPVSEFELNEAIMVKERGVLKLKTKKTVDFEITQE